MMASSYSSSSLFHSASALFVGRKRIHDELTRGRQIADQLRVNLSETNDGDAITPSSPSPVDLKSAQGLVGKIIETFTESLLMLNGGGATVEADDVVSQGTPVIADSSPAGGSGDRCKTRAHKDGRGCYKRRKTSETYTKETTDSFEDGYAWRKYGQKKILDSKYPRNYYRCTHKFDRSCKAKKHVQQIQENPPLYRTTYEFHHTCNLNTVQSLLPHPPQLLATNIINTNIIIREEDSSSLIWNFQLHHQPNQEVELPSPFAYSDGVVGGVDYYSMPSFEDRAVKAAADDDHLAAFSSSVTTDHHGDVMSNSDVISCAASTHSAMDRQLNDVFNGGVDSSDFDDFLTDGLS